VGPDAEQLVESLQGTVLGSLAAARIAALRETLDQSARFSPELRFILVDEERRTFHAERWCYLGSIDDWIYLTDGTVFRLVQELIPRLGSDAFFEPIPPGSI
jgi:hypothetical protein